MDLSLARDSCGLIPERDRGQHILHGGILNAGLLLQAGVWRPLSLAFLTVARR